MAVAVDAEIMPLHQSEVHLAVAMVELLVGARWEYRATEEEVLVLRSAESTEPFPLTLLTAELALTVPM
jgi:hypothetical protein